MVKFTSIVLSVGGVIKSVRAHSDWMGPDEVDAYLEGFERTVEDGMHVLFARITLHSDVGEADGGWTSAYRRNGRWDLAMGSVPA